MSEYGQLPERLAPTQDAHRLSVGLPVNLQSVLGHQRGASEYEVEVLGLVTLTDDDSFWFEFVEPADFGELLLHPQRKLSKLLHGGAEPLQCIFKFLFSAMFWHDRQNHPRPVVQLFLRVRLEIGWVKRESVSVLLRGHQVATHHRERHLTHVGNHRDPAVVSQTSDEEPHDSGRPLEPLTWREYFRKCQP